MDLTLGACRLLISVRKALQVSFCPLQFSVDDKPPRGGFAEDFQLASAHGIRIKMFR